MFTELFSSFRSSLSERFFSPLSGSFVLSWVLYNYEVVLTVFSGLSVYEKVALIESYIYPDFIYFLVHAIAVPLLIALFYIYVYPRPAKYVMIHALKFRRELDEAKNNALKLQVLTVEDSQKIITRLTTERVQHREQVASLQAEIEELQAVIADLNKANVKNKKSSVKIEDLAIAVGNSSDGSRRDNHGFDYMGVSYDDISFAFSNLSFKEMFVIGVLYDMPSGGVVSAIWEKVKLEQSVEEFSIGDIIQILDQLYSAGFVGKNKLSGDPRYQLGADARAIFYKMKVS